MTQALHLFERLMSWESQFEVGFELVPAFGYGVLDRLKINRGRNGPCHAITFRDQRGATARSIKRAR